MPLRSSFRSVRFTLAVAVLGASLAPLAGASTTDAISQSFQKMTRARFHTEATITDEKGKVTHTRGDYDTMDRIHLVTDHGEFVILPEGTWMKMGGNWSKPPMDMSGMVKRFLPMGEEMLRTAKNVADEGATTWQGQPVHAYSYDIDSTVMGAQVTGHSKIYVNRAGQFVGGESDTLAMGHKSHSVQTLSYDDSVRVSAPQ